MALPLRPGQPFAAPQQPTYVVQPRGGCDCSVPTQASSSVKATRVTTVVIIVVHSICLASFGFYLLWQWAASLMVIISGSVLLCQFNKCAYTTAAILYSVGCLLDLLAVATWIFIGESWDDDDYNNDDGGSVFAWLALPPAIGAVTLVVGAVFALKAVCNWEQSGAPGTTAVQAVTHVSYPAPAYPVVGVPQQARHQMYSSKAGDKGVPPGHFSTDA